MTTYAPDGLFAFGNAETVELPRNDARPDTANDATAKAPLGTLYRYKGNLFRYVKFDNGQGNVAAVQYGVVHWMTAKLDPSVGLFTVTSDYTDALAGVNSVAGVTGCVVTDGYYTWIQVGGAATVYVAALTAIGDILIGSATDEYLGRIAAGQAITSVCYGVALSAVASNKSTVRLNAHRLASL